MSRAGHAETAMRAAPNVRDQSPLDVALLKIVDGGLAGCIFVVPLLMGGRQGLGQLVLAALAVGVALAWMLRQCQRRASFWRYSSAEWLLAAGVVLLLVQTLSLSPSTLAWVAPRTGEILPLWTETAPTAAAESSTSLGIWSCVSLTPHETKAGLTIFLSYCLLFLVTMQRIRTLEDVERLERRGLEGLHHHGPRLAFLEGFV